MSVHTKGSGNMISDMQTFKWEKNTSFNFSCQRGGVSANFDASAAVPLSLYLSLSLSLSISFFLYLCVCVYVCVCSGRLSPQGINKLYPANYSVFQNLIRIFHFSVFDISHNMTCTWLAYPFLTLAGQFIIVLLFLNSRKFSAKFKTYI